MFRRSLYILLVPGIISACGMQPRTGSQAQTGQEGNNVANYHHSKYEVYSSFDQTSRRDVLHQIAVEYLTGTIGHDPVKLIHYLNGCYSLAIGALDRQDSLQRCMMLDYTTYKEILEGRHRPTAPERYYFGQAAAGARWAQYGPEAGFTDPDRMFDYLRKAYAYVRDEAESIRSYSRPAFESQ